ncbi:hypothetical protein WR25_05655 [Diploscapter pachys]|uniref:Uncharacterized protein n=1 Tax=Diploscapter pachys TaxID=2018661 RepID=A0A2A2JY34_9BILA|nr:hypothetical protein WR25_05655 [Diploscapter pachys]
MPRRRQHRIQHVAREGRGSHEDDPHGGLQRAGGAGRNPLSVPHGIPRNRGADPGARAPSRPRPPIRPSRGAAPAEETRGRARPVARRVGGGGRAAGDVRHLRQRRHRQPLRDLRRSAPRPALAVRRRRGGRPLGARTLAPVSRSLPCARRPPVGARGRPP